VQAGQGSLELVFGNIWIVIQFVLDVEASRRAPENEMAHLVESDGLTAPGHDLAQGSRERSGTFHKHVPAKGQRVPIWPAWGSMPPERKS
jgi:hypothetical protein